MFRTKKAQSTLEYIIIFTAIVVAVFVVSYKTLKPAVQKLADQSASVVTSAANTFNPSP